MGVVLKKEELNEIVPERSLSYVG